MRKQSAPSDPLYTIQELAQFIGISQMTLWEWVKYHDLPVVRFSQRTIRVQWSAFQAWMEARNHLVEQVRERKKGCAQD